MSQDRLRMLEREALLAKNAIGDAAELGVYRGGSAILLAQVLTPQVLHAFESFEGLTNLGAYDRARRLPSDRGHAPGDFAISAPRERERVRQRLKRFGVRLHEGHFLREAAALNDMQFCFAHFDGDTYRSAIAFLEFFVPRLSIGGRLVLDDFGWEATPGVETAARDFFGSDTHVSRLATYQAVFVKA